MLKQRNMRVEAGWLFKRGDQGLNASSEQSETANEDILIFFFQLDLATRVQVRWDSFHSLNFILGYGISLYFVCLTRICFFGDALAVCFEHGTV